MSIEEKLKAEKPSSNLADKVADTLSLFADTRPLTPTKSSQEFRWNKEKDMQKYDPKNEKDISMLTNISSDLVLLTGLEKALSVTHPCEARTAFMEQMLRSARSKDGWGLKQTIEALKAIRQPSEDEEQAGRLRRFTNWVSGKKE